MTSWGVSFAMSKVAIETIHPAWVAAMRLAIGALVLLAIAASRGSLPSRDGRSLLIYLWLGFIGNALPFILITWGLQHITSGVGGLLMGTIPLFITAIAHLLLPAERMTPNSAVGVLLGFCGIVVLVGADELFSISLNGDELWGEAAVVLGCFCYGLNGVSAKLLVTRDVFGQSAGVLLSGALLAGAAAWVQHPDILAGAASHSLLATLGLGLIPTGLATVLWFKALMRTGPTFVSMSNFFVPVFAVLFGALTLGETVGWNVLAALGLILAGVFVSRLRRPLSK